MILFAAYLSDGRSPGFYDRRTSTGIAAIAFVHAAMFLFPAMLIALPKPAPRNMGSDILVGLFVIVNTRLVLFCVLLQYPLQYLELRRMSGAPGALSLVSLGLQAVVILAVAVRWLLRLGAPTWEDQSAPLQHWFQWVSLLWCWYQWGALALNYILHGVGCATLLALYLVASRGGRRQDMVSEETSLLT